MDRRTIRKFRLIKLLARLGIGAAGFVIVLFVASPLAGRVSLLFIGIGVIVAAVSWFLQRLEENEQLEKLEFDELTRTKKATTLFQTTAAEDFPAQRAREQ